MKTIQKILLFSVLVFALTAASDANRQLSADIGEIQAIWMSPNPDRKACEKRYLALVRKYDSSEARYRVTLDLFSMFAQEGRTYSEEVVKYARDLLALTPVPAEAAKAHDFIGSALLSQGLTDANRQEIADHFISSLNLALRHLGKIRKTEDIPRPTASGERKDQAALVRQYVLLEPLVFYRQTMPDRILGIFQRDKVAMIGAVQRVVPNTIEADAILVELGKDKETAEEKSP